MVSHLALRIFSLLSLLILLLCNAVHADELVIGVEDKDWAGHYRWKGDKLEGLDAEILRQVAKRAGHTITFKPYPWKRVMYLAEEAQIDGVLDLAPTARRKQFLHYITPAISVESTVFWVSKNSSFSFNGTLPPNLTLGLMRGSDWSDRFKRHGKPRVVRFDSYRAAFTNLAAGRIDTFGGHAAPTREQARILGFLNKIRASKPQLDALDYFVALTHKPGHNQLAKELSQAMQDFFNSEDYAKLRWQFGYR